MRLLIWCPTVNPGGGERLLARLIEGLLAHPEVEQVGVTAHGPLKTIFEKLNDSRGRLHVISISNPNYRAWNAFAPFPWLQQTFANWSRNRVRKRLQHAYRQAENRFDIVYCFWAQHELFVQSQRPVIATIQDLTILQFPEILGEQTTSTVYRETERWLENSTVVVSSNAMMNNIRRLFPAIKAPLYVVHHAISPNRRTDLESSSTTTPISGDYVIYPANINTHKNHYMLLNGYSRWSQRGKIPLVLTGPRTHLLRQGESGSTDWQIARLRSLIQRLGLREGSDFFTLGLVPDAVIANLIAHAWCLIMPSLAEGGGSFPVEEALQLGVPVACSDIPVMREHLAFRTSKIAWFDPESVADITAALDQIYSRYSEFKESAMRGQNDVRPKWTDIASSYVEIFKEVLQNTGKS